MSQLIARALALIAIGFITGCQEPEPPSRTLPAAVLMPAPTTMPAEATATAAAGAASQPAHEMVMMSVRTLRATLPVRATAGNGGTMPDPVQTPGAVFIDATPEKVCVSGYTATVRNVPMAVRKQVFANYGVDYAQHSHYEVDHLISLELGGSNDITNLWPEPYDGPWNAHMKDQLENKLHRMVCDGQITMAEAQQEIATNWIAAYQKYVGP
jgi:hypothetical protein